MRRAALVVGLVVLLAEPAGAQRGGRRDQDARTARRPRAEVRALAVRAELAEVLLQSGRYPEAAREYRQLLDTDSANSRYRLGLAQALAWGRRYRDAERELRILASAPRANASVDTLLRMVREGMRPRAREASDWVREQPSYVPYRLSLARALVRERQHRAALAQLDTVLLQGPSPLALVERAQVNFALENRDAAIADLTASIAAAPTTEAYLALGDVHRSRGEYASARSFYETARTMSPASRHVASRFAQLARDVRPPVVFGTPVDVQPGWGTSATMAGDKVGTQYSTLSAHRGFSVPFGVLGGTGIEVRHLRERLPQGVARTTGVAAEVALARGVSYGALYGELGASGGVVHHPGAGSRSFGSVVLTAQYHAWAASGEISEGPAYPSLLTTAFLTPSDGDEAWLSERTVVGSLAGPIGGTDAGVSVRRSSFSDGNERTAVQAYARYPLSAHLSAIYSGNSVAFADRSALYWDPVSHIANAVGIRIANRRLRGLSYSANLLPGVAWSDDSPFDRAAFSDPGENRLRLQIAASGELVYRAGEWEAAASYGWGRLGTYERSDARVGLRFAP